MTHGVSILVPTHNRMKILDQTLRSLSEVRVPGDTPTELVVIANACTDGTEELVRSWRSRMPFPVHCAAEPQPGLSRARNRAMGESRYGICALIDDDVWVAKTWLEALVDIYRATPADMVAGHIELWWQDVARPAWLTRGMECNLSCLDLGPTIVEMHRPDAIGANFCFRREVFDRVGPFRTDLGRIGGKLLGGEETYFLREAMKAGFRLFYSPGASLKHWVSPHRVEPPYLTGVARGTAYTIILLKERFGVVEAGRALVLGSARFAGHSLLAPPARLMGAKGRYMRSIVRRAVGQGQVLGALARLRNGPLKPGNHAAESR